MSCGCGFPTSCDRQLCTESIYQAIYDPDIPVSRPAKRRRRRRRRQLQGQERRGRLVGMTMIADRPAEVDDRVEVGHWEGDCIKGAGNRSAIGTLVERRTRFLILVHLPDGRATAEAMQAGLTATLGRLPADLRRTLTWDQGRSWHCTRRSPNRPARRCSSAMRTRPGSGAATRT